ncbi:MAG: fibronectin type III domain-containing protein [Deltaproteobacteria bacterium]|jgi:predicted small lipoprotein YifL|nr:fibronectin type III domain-containing protein [Deltaproteobacteria bacterium]
MTKPTTRQLFSVIFLMGIASLVLAVLAGCGRKGPIKPKLLSLPAAPEAVSLLQQGETLLLSWTLPSKNQDGSAAEDLVGFRIRRYVYPADEHCPTCREPQETMVNMDIDYPDPGLRIGKRLHWRDTAVERGYGYRYAITPVTLGRNSGETAYAHQILYEPPPEPVGLQAEPGDQTVKLTWQQPPLPDSMTLVGYNLYRRESGQFFLPVPLNSEPLSQTALADRGLLNGQAYEYRVSVVVEFNDRQLESLGSQSVLITPQPDR